MGTLILHYGTPQASVWVHSRRIPDLYGEGQDVEISTNADATQRSGGGYRHGIRQFATRLRTQTSADSPKEWVLFNRTPWHPLYCNGRNRPGGLQLTFAIQHWEVPLGHPLRTASVEGKGYRVIRAAREHAVRGKPFKKGAHKGTLRSKAGITYRKQRRIRWAALRGIAIRILDIPRGRNIGAGARGSLSLLGSTTKTATGGRFISGDTNLHLGFLECPAKRRIAIFVELEWG